VVVKKDNPNKDCARCHSEHNGETFQLIRWQPSLEKFDHGQTGYTLEGKHATVGCRQCHSAAHMVAEMQKLVKYKDLGKSFLASRQIA
jgi:NAD-dependent dihydropyrimidine dehydrogenase PreA subunit